jgi:Tfp pilus assembly protein PilV
MESRREGYTLSEVIIALLMFSVLGLGTQAMVANMIRTVARDNIQVTAAQLADDRIDLIRLDPQYDSLAWRYTGNETTIPGHAGLTRNTTVTRTQQVTGTGPSTS